MLSVALKRLDQGKLKLLSAAPIIDSRPLGPSQRTYANTAAVIRTKLDPAALLERLQAIERHFGRRPGGQRWAARVLDLDIVLWSGGSWASPGLIVPHLPFRERLFVLRPATVLAPRWRDLVTGLTLRQLLTRLTQPRPLPIRAGWKGP